MNTSFYEELMNNSNVKDCNSLKLYLETNQPSFAWDEFNKDIREINWETVLNSMDFNKMNTVWMKAKADKRSVY